MNCCSCEPGTVNDLNNTFNRKRAEADARDYRRKGLSKRGQKLIAYVTGQISRPVSVLDIGCGAGGVHHELLRRGLAEKAIGVEASSAYLAAAQDNAHQFNLTGRVHYTHRDFALTPDEFHPADVVIMDRVICCYPHLAQLLGAAAERTQRWLALSFPLETWWYRVGFNLIDKVISLFGSKYHPYLHPHADIINVAATAGLRPVYKDRAGLWQIMVFGRAVDGLPD